MDIIQRYLFETLPNVPEYRMGALYMIVGADLIAIYFNPFTTGFESQTVNSFMGFR